jgi:hypothetical protein
MTKQKFKEELKELIQHYLRKNKNKKDFPHSISFDYTIEEPNKNSYGELVFGSDKKDALLKIKSIDYKD